MDNAPAHTDSKAIRQHDRQLAPQISDDTLDVARECGISELTQGTE
jgi:hypothetical protein